MIGKTGKRDRSVVAAVLAAAAAGAVVGTVVPAEAATGTWTGAADANWQTLGNWVGGIPNATTDDATFFAPGATNLTLSLSANSTVRSLTFNGETTAGNVTIGVTTAAALTITGATTDNVVVAAGTHVIRGAGVTAGVEVRLGSSGNGVNFNVASGASLEINGRINQGNSGNSYQKNGGGTLILSGANGGGGGWNFTGGGFSVNAGTLVLANNGATGNSGNRVTVNNGGVLELRANYGSNNGLLTINNGGTLRSTGGTRSMNGGTNGMTVNGDATVDVVDNQLTISKAIGGGGNLVKAGAGTLVVNAANTLTGNVVVSAGTLTLSAAGALGTATAIDVRGGATFDVTAQPGYAVASGQTLGGTGTVVGSVAAGAGATVNPALAGAAGTFTLANDLTLSGGALAFDLSNDLAAGNDRLVVTGNLNLADGTNSVVRVASLNAGAFAAGDYTLATYAGLGGTGTLALAPLKSRQSMSLSAGATALVLSVGAGAPASLVWAGEAAANAWDQTSDNWVNLTAGGTVDEFYDGDTVAFNGTDTAPATVTLAGMLAPTAVNVSGAKGYTFAGAGTIAGGSLNKSGAGGLTLANADGNQVNAVTVSGGTLTVANGSRFGSLVVDGGTVTFANTSPASAGAVTVGAGGTLAIGDKVTAGAGQINNVSITNNGVVALDRVDGFALANVISGTGAVTKDAASTVTFSGANTYSGNTTVAAGTVVVTNAVSLGASSLGLAAGSAGSVTVKAGASVDLVGNATAQALNFGGKKFVIAGTGAAGTGAITNSGTTSQFNAFQHIELSADATVGGTGRFDIRSLPTTGLATTLDLAGHTLTKLGTSQFGLVGTNVTDGNIVVNSGIFAVETVTQILAGTGTGGPGSITLNPSAAGTAVAGTIFQAFNLSGPITRPIVVASAGGGGGTVAFGNAQASTSTIGSPITLNGDAIVAGTNNVTAGSLVLNGVISGTGSITKSTGITLVLGGANTYTGNTTVNGGVLALNHAQALGQPAAGSVLTMAGGTTLRADTSAAAPHASVVLSGGGTVTVAVTAAPSTLTFAAGLSSTDGTGLSKTGPGTAMAKNVRVPSLAIDGGTLRIAADGGNDGASVVSNLTVATGAGAALDLNDSGLVLDYAGGTPLDTVRQLIATAARGTAGTDAENLWSGPGITSNAARNIALHVTPGPATGLGYDESLAYHTRFDAPGDPAMFLGQTIDNDAVLVLYTYKGDANLDRRVTDADVDLLVANFGSTSAVWAQADFNYDRRVDDADLDLLAAAAGASGEPAIQVTAAGLARLAALRGTAVPEPAGIALLALTAGVLTARRRRC